MSRFKLLIEYDGTPYSGWQRQDNAPSIQAALESAAEALCGEETVIFAAGRTDAGVHAIAMTAHIDLPKDYMPDTVRDAINQYLKPAPISVLSAERVSDQFHARFSCIARHYRYEIINRRSPIALKRNRAWQVSAPIDAAVMHEAAQLLTGKHDFSTFRTAQCQATSPIKTLSAISVKRDAEKVTIDCSAPSFLHSQVRSLAGSLVKVGLGRWAPSKLKAVLQSCDRSECGPVAPACGLYFLQADYEKA